MFELLCRSCCKQIVFCRFLLFFFKKVMSYDNKTGRVLKFFCVGGNSRLVYCYKLMFFRNCDFLETNRDEMVANVVKSHFTRFDFQKISRSPDIFSTISRLCVRLGFLFLCALLAVQPFAMSFGFREFWANQNANSDGYSGCAAVRYLSQYISLPFSTKQLRIFSNF